MPSRKRAKPAASQESARNSKKRKTDVVSAGADGKRGGTNAVVSGLKIGSDAKDEEDGAKDQDGDNEDREDDREEGGVGKIKRGAKQRLEVLEEELGTAKGSLQRNAKILSCNAEFEGNEPRTAEVLARIHSPEKTGKYIEVHFSYHSRPRTRANPIVEWFYTLGYKIFSGAPASATSLGAFRGHAHASTYDREGWRSIAYAFFKTNDYGWRPWTHAEIFSVDVTSEGLSEVHEALWGPLKALPSSASAADHTKRRRTLIRALRVLLASVCIDYTIACEDEEIDLQPGYGLRQNYIGWMLEGAEDRWLARGVRKACGFQLKWDPREEIEGNEDRKQKAIGDHDEDCDHEDDDGEEEEEEEEGNGEK